MMKWALILLLPIATHATASVNVFGDSNEVNNEVVFQDRLWDHESHRELIETCIGPNETHYFEVEIRLEPDTNSTGVCNVADQVLLGNDLNQLLLDYGVGEAGADDDAVFLAGVCPEPETTSIDERRLANWLRRLAFLWRGGGGCRFCLKDNKDDRNLQGNWFANTFAPDMEDTLENAILTQIVPVHTSCLGGNPTIAVELVEVTLEDLDLECDDGKIIEKLESLNLANIPLRRRNCEQCVSIDFSEDAQGVKLDKGEWIGNQWKDAHGLTITATGGYSPSFNARIFDTADATCVVDEMNLDFGSPNKDCHIPPGSDILGLGEGKGGKRGKKGENCDPVGNVLIVQESNKECPDANPMGGTLTFQWDEPVLLSDIGLMDVDEKNQRIKIEYADGFEEIFTFRGFGDNAVQRVVASKLNVVKVVLEFPGTAAVTEINFCPECRALAGHDDDHHCLYTGDDTYMKAHQVKYFEDFEKSNSIKKWENGKLSSDPNFTSMLGKYAKNNPLPYKTYKVNRWADGIIFELDFYELDSWKSGDEAFIYVDAEKIDLGEFRSAVDEGYGEGTTPIGVSWQRNSTSAPSNDQSHHIKIIIPESTGLYGDGELRLTLATHFPDTATGESAGWDNIKVTIVHSCSERGRSSAIIPEVDPAPQLRDAPQSQAAAAAVAKAPQMEDAPQAQAAAKAPQMGDASQAQVAAAKASPTSHPTRAPTPGGPTRQPSKSPTRFPTRKPTTPPTQPPSRHPTRSPTLDPNTDAPTPKTPTTPTRAPTRRPANSPKPFKLACATSEPPGSDAIVTKCLVRSQ